jgi:hypothetical protein
MAKTEGRTCERRRRATNDVRQAPRPEWAALLDSLALRIVDKLLTIEGNDEGEREERAR